MADKTTGKLKLWIAKITDKISDTINTYLPENFTKIDTEFSSLKDDVESHLAENASTSQKGHVQLSTSTSSTSTSLAATASAVKTVNDALTSHKGDITTHGGIYHKNLLHNWDFRNPVNQRGRSSYSGVGYSIDRWQLGNNTASLNVETDYITVADPISGHNFFIQQIENPALFAGKTITFSVDVVAYKNVALRIYDGEVQIGNFNIANVGVNYLTVTLPESITSNLQVVIRSINANASISLKSAKLELGSISTLANDPPADYGEQLALCQRYYQKIYILRPLCSCHPTRIEIMVPLSVPLRSVPTIESYSVPGWFRVDGIQYVGSDYIAASNAAFVLDSNYNMFTGAITIMFSLSPEISAITNKLGYISVFNAALSADL